MAKERQYQPPPADSDSTFLTAAVRVQPIRNVLLSALLAAAIGEPLGVIGDCDYGAVFAVDIVGRSVSLLVAAELGDLFIVLAGLFGEAFAGQRRGGHEHGEGRSKEEGELHCGTGGRAVVVVIQNEEVAVNVFWSTSG